MLTLIALELAGLNMLCVLLVYYLRRADLKSAVRGERRIELAERLEDIETIAEVELRQIRKAVDGELALR